MSVQDIFALMNERRFDEASLPWAEEALPGLDGIFAVAFVSQGQPSSVVLARSPADLPTQLRRWLGPAGGRVSLETLTITGSRGAETDFGLTWTRERLGSKRLHGLAKGVWDCEAERLLVVNAEERVKRAGSGSEGTPCEQPLVVLPRHGMRTRVCDERAA